MQDAHEFYIAAINGMHAADRKQQGIEGDGGEGDPKSVTQRIFGGQIQSDVVR